MQVVTPPVAAPGPFADSFAQRKDYFEAVKVLRDVAWRSFERRVDVEWKFSFALWTALSAIFAGVVTRQATLNSSTEQWALSVIVISTVLLHAYWSAGMQKSNDTDLAKAYALEDEMRATLGLTGGTTTGSRLESILKGKAKRKLTKHWGHVTQVLISLLLATGVIIGIWLRN